MAHILLFLSSCVMLAAHVPLLFRVRPWALRLSYALGPLASVWNHASCSWPLAKLCDRCLMALGFALDMWLIEEKRRHHAVPLLVAAVVAYVYAKIAGAGGAGGTRGAGGAGVTSLDAISLLESRFHVLAWPSALHITAHCLATAAHSLA